MNTDTGAVFDFAGQGYVHRLAMMDFDSLSAESDNATAAHSKLTEVPDPRSDSDVRPVMAPVSRGEAEHTIALKLEHVAQQYSHLLAVEMGRQRRQHEEQLNRIRSFMQEETATLLAQSKSPGVKSGTTTTSTSSSSSTSSSRIPNDVAFPDTAVVAWRSRIQSQLQTDRSRAMKQMEQTQQRVARACSELEDALELQRALVDNERQSERLTEREQAAFDETEAGNRLVSTTYSFSIFDHDCNYYFIVL
jgi:hypothetical protein